MKTVKRRTWTDEQIEFLRQHSEEYLFDELVDIIGKSRSAVRHMLDRLGVKHKTINGREREPVKKWTEAELEILRQEYPVSTAEEVAQLLGRSKKSVGAMAESLGILKKGWKRWEDWELQYIRDHYENTDNKLIADKLGRSVKSIIHAAQGMDLNKPGIQVDKHYHYWTVVSEVYYKVHNGSNEAFVLADCRCGVNNPHEVNVHALKVNHSKSCGCWTKEVLSRRGGRWNEKNDHNLGDVFHESIKVVGEKRLAQCGKELAYQIDGECLRCGSIKTFWLSNLRSGTSKSCGCVNKDRLSERNTTHGMTGTSLYSRWQNMLRRCNNPDDIGFKHYGGRGIKVCEEWYSFENFARWALANGYSEDLTLERLSVDGDYCPENCTWADWFVQQNNTRRNRREEAFGETKTVAEWTRDERCKVGYGVLESRLNRLGWSFLEALTTPVMKSGKQDKNY